MTSRLQVLTGERADSLSDVSAAEVPPPLTRPHERLEPWPLAEETRRALATAASARHLPLITAGALVVERSLLAHDLDRRASANIAGILDEIARQPRVEVALSEPQRAYLRVLGGVGARTALHRTMPHILPLPLPMRLRERIGEGALERWVDVSLLGSAVLWERAAVLSGRTMSEWATLVALKTRS